MEAGAKRQKREKTPEELQLKQWYRNMEAASMGTNPTTILFKSNAELTYRFLSNFYPCNMMLKDQLFSVEIAYHFVFQTEYLKYPKSDILNQLVHLTMDAENVMTKSCIVILINAFAFDCNCK